MQRAVGDAEIIEMNHDFAQVIQRGAGCADTLHDQCRRVFRLQVADVLPMLPTSNEGQSRHSISGLEPDWQQLRFVDVVRHLPLPKQRPCFRNVAGDNAKGEAVARTAAIEAESEARFVGSPPTADREDTERAVVTAQERAP